MKRGWTRPVFSMIGPLVITEKWTQKRPIGSPVFRKLGSFILFRGKSEYRKIGLIQPLLKIKAFSRDSIRLIEVARPLCYLCSTNIQNYCLFSSI